MKVLWVMRYMWYFWRETKYLRGAINASMVVYSEFDDWSECHPKDAVNEELSYWEDLW